MRATSGGSVFGTSASRLLEHTRAIVGHSFYKCGQMQLGGRFSAVPKACKDLT